MGYEPESGDRVAILQRFFSQLRHLGVNTDTIRSNNRVPLKRKPMLANITPMHTCEKMLTVEFQNELDALTEEINYKESSITYYMIEDAIRSIIPKAGVTKTLSFERLVAEIYCYLDNKESFVDTYRYLKDLYFGHFPDGIYYHTGEYNQLSKFSKVSLISND